MYLNEFKEWFIKNYSHFWNGNDYYIYIPKDFEYIEVVTDTMYYGTFYSYCLELDRNEIQDLYKFFIKQLRLKKILLIKKYEK